MALPGSAATSSRGRASVAVLVAAAILLLLVVPGAFSLSHGDGALCIASSSCPLAAINPCVRRPSFSIVGRCAIPIR